MFLWIIALLSVLSVSPVSLRLGIGKRVPTTILDKSILSPPPYQLPLLKGDHQSPMNYMGHNGVFTSLPSNSSPLAVHSAVVITVYGGEAFQNVILTHITHLTACSTNYASKVPILVVIPERIEVNPDLQLDRVLGHRTRIIVVSVYEPEPSTSSLTSPTGPRILLGPSVFPEISGHPNSELYNYIHSHVAHEACYSQKPLALPPKSIMSRQHAIVEHVSVILFSPNQSVPKLIHYLSALVALQDHQSEHGHKNYMGSYLSASTEGQERIALYFPVYTWVLAGVCVLYCHCRSSWWTQKLHLSTVFLIACAPLGPILLSRVLVLYASINSMVCKYNMTYTYCYLFNIISLCAVILSIQIDIAFRSNICILLIICIYLLYDTMQLFYRQNNYRKCYNGRYNGNYWSADKVLSIYLLPCFIKALQLVQNHISPSFFYKKLCDDPNANMNKEQDMNND